MPGFQLVKAPNGVRIFYEKVPGVKFVSIELAIFSGSMDDQEAGGEGIMHWLEHVPFKGTSRYPKGRVDICEPFQRFAGRIGACTGKTQTCYYARVPSNLWLEALDVLVSLVSEPLLSEQSVREERQVIESEISVSNSQYTQWKRNELSKLLKSDHPWFKPTLGTKESLHAVTPENLRLAHQKMYDRSRAVLVIAGDIKKVDIVAASKKLERLPDNKLSPRQYPASYGQIAPWSLETEITQAPFPASAVLVVWPTASVDEKSRIKKELVMGRIESSLGNGGLSSPLMRILREERQLVYGASASAVSAGIDSGLFSIQAETASQGNIEAVVEGIFDALLDKQTFSSDWYQFVTDQIVGSNAMRTVDPGKLTDYMLERISLGADRIFTNDEDVTKAFAEVDFKDYLERLQDFSRENAKVLIFEGTNM